MANEGTVEHCSLTDRSVHWPSDMLTIQLPPSSVFFESTQLRPEAICSFDPVASPVLASWCSTLADHRFTLGATPTTPRASSAAPIVPATCVPWPSSSFGSLLPVMALKPPL